LEEEFAGIGDFDLGHGGGGLLAILAPSHVADQAASRANVHLEVASHALPSLPDDNGRHTVNWSEETMSRSIKSKEAP
jgi:hypothetical protein